MRVIRILTLAARACTANWVTTLSVAIASATTRISTIDAYFCATIISVTVGFSSTSHLFFVVLSSSANT
jgi:hypothetical protein